MRRTEIIMRWLGRLFLLAFAVGMVWVVRDCAAPAKAQDLSVTKIWGELSGYRDAAGGGAVNDDSILMWTFASSNLPVADSSFLGTSVGTLGLTGAGNPTWQTNNGATNAYYQFDSPAEQIGVWDSDLWSLGNGNTGFPRTICLWIRAANWTNSPYLVAKDSGGANKNREWAFAVSSLGRPYWTVWAETASSTNRIYLATLQSIVSNYWWHLAVTYDGSRIGTNSVIYTNGVIAPWSGTTPQNMSDYWPTNGTAPLTISAITNKGVWYSGDMGKVSIYSNALTSNQIWSLWNVEKGGYPNP